MGSGIGRIRADRTVNAADDLMKATLPDGFAIESKTLSFPEADRDLHGSLYTFTACKNNYLHCQPVTSERMAAKTLWPQGRVGSTPSSRATISESGARFQRQRPSFRFQIPAKFSSGFILRVEKHPFFKPVFSLG